MLLGGAVSPDGKTLAIANCGFGKHAINIIDIDSEKAVATVPLDHAWNGIAWSPDGATLYVAGGISTIHHDIFVLENRDGKWTQTRTLALSGNDPKRTCVAGMALSADGNTLYAVNNSDNRLYALDAHTGAARSAGDAGDHPVACKLSTDGKQLFVSDWGGAQVQVFGFGENGNFHLVNTLKTGIHPNDLIMSRDNRLYVSCGNSDAVYVYDLTTGQPLETIKTTLTPRSPYGSTPNAVAVSPDNKTLYVANADNNDVCVVDVSHPGKSRVRGFIPTGWYPTAVVVSPDGKKVFIGSGKGVGPHPNPGTVKPDKPVSPDDYKFQYIGEQLNGILAAVDTPDDAQLAAYTKEAYADSPYNDHKLVAAAAERKTAIPSRVGQPCPIKHVLYIIKENRTYDQMFGDLSQGNGDPSLTLFGRDVTPNHHALAEQFVLLDNIYCNGEVSEDGHPWSTSAIAMDFTQRSWVMSYSGKGDTEGGDSVEVPPAGYLWDACKRKGLTYRSYGEYTYATSIKAAPEQRVEGATGLKGHGSPSYVGIGRPANAGRMRDTEKADAFVAEFKEFERTHTIPNFMVMSLGEDHTTGTEPGTFTPKAAVASNDVALGKIVDTISHSSAWKEFAIFVIEDDAQNGPDHVDSHRTASLVISPYTKRKYVDSTMYSTVSIERTIELILGLPPLTQYDAAATPMYASFTNHADLTPYTSLQARIDITAKNPPEAYGATASARMDFHDYDRADPDELNRILWHSIKGANVPMPAPVSRFIARR